MNFLKWSLSSDVVNFLVRPHDVHVVDGTLGGSHVFSTFDCKVTICKLSEFFELVDFLWSIFLNDIRFVRLVRSERNQENVMELDVKTTAGLSSDLAGPFFAIRAFAQKLPITKSSKDHSVGLHFILEDKLRVV
jgi:hypothetical protein